MAVLGLGEKRFGDLGGLADGVFTGGLETSASMLSLGTAVLLERREVYGRIADDPAYTERVVEELLRYLSVVQVGFPRFVRQDVEVGGQPVRTRPASRCRSASDIPPLTPYSSRWATACARHCWMTGHCAQSFLAAVSLRRRRLLDSFSEL